MKKLWWKLVYPINPALGLSREERRSVWQRARLFAKHDPKFKRTMLLVAFSMLALIVLMIYFRLTPVFFFDWIEGLIIQYVGASAAQLMMLIIYISPMLFFFLLGRTLNNPFVNRAIREHGYDVCIKCGYWLKELPLEEIKHCPECSEVRVSMPECLSPTLTPK